MAAQLAVALLQRRHADLRADVVAEHRRGSEIALPMGIQRHRVAPHVVSGEQRQAHPAVGVVKRRLAAVGEHRDLGRVEQRGGRVRLIRARAQHAEQMRRGRQHLRPAGDPVGRVAVRVHACAGHLVGQHAACRVDRGRRRLAARHRLRPERSSGPVNGLNAATVRVEFFAAPGCADEHAAVVETARTAAAATSARARVRRDFREVTSGYRTPFLYAARVLPQKRPAVTYLNVPAPSRYVPRARRRPGHNYPNPSSRAMSIRCTSEVPSPISSTFASR